MKKLSYKKYAKTLGYWAKNIRDERFPFYASFKCTMRCRYTCSFCNCWKDTQGDISTEEATAILENLGRSSLFLVSFEGGEPLQRKDIGELLQVAHKQPYYVMFTTCQKKLLSYPWDEYQNYIDFLEISIDEGHNNLDYFDLIEEMNSYDMVLCVQTVVRDQDISEMEWKVKKCQEVGCKILLMPAVHLESEEYAFPEFDFFESEIIRLKKAYPGVVITPNAYLRNVKKPVGGCSPNSVLIDGDGSLIYPCRTLEEKTVKLQEVELLDYLESQDAIMRRNTMKTCTKQCGWYQHFATSSFTNPMDIKDAIAPYAREVFEPFFKSKKKK